jgi:ABC-2 type transport system permease protein
VSGLLGSVVRTTSFLRKDVMEALRQPRLLLTLVVAPFLILFLFGAGLREYDPPFTTMFVAPEDSDIAAEVVEFAQAQAERLTVEGVTTNEEEALERLRSGELQMVIVFPEDVEETIRADERAVIRLYHDEIDPIEGQAIHLFMELAVHEANRQLLTTLVEEGQAETEELDEGVSRLRSRTQGVRAALQRDDPESAEAELELLRADLAALAVVAGATGALAERDGDEESFEAALERLSDRVDELSDRPDGDAVTEGEVGELEADLVTLEEGLVEFRGMSPEILAAPLRAEIHRIAETDVRLSDFYAPAVMVVLLQHLLTALVALSIVREEQLGTTELYRVAPLRMGELVVGKYLAYLVLGAVVAGLLLLTLLVGLGVPMHGSWAALVAVVAGVLLASAGLGFLVALASRTDSQAVQYSMMALLVAVFFSGFLLSLDRFLIPVRWVAWLVPATYGIELLREIMLRGSTGQPLLLVALLAIGVALAILSWVGLRRRMVGA